MSNLITNTIEFSLKNDLNEISRLSSQLKKISVRFVLSKIDSHDINLVLEEWFTNLVRHGYQKSEESEITVRITISDTTCHLTISDEGRYFNPRQFNLPDLNKNLDERVPGGLGLHLIFKLMDSISYKKEKN